VERNGSRVVGKKSQPRPFLEGSDRDLEEECPPMRLILFGFFLGLAAAGSVAEKETSSQRLAKSQEGVAEASWPRKPDNRISPLSGKMKEVTEISPRFYSEEKEFRVRQLGEWQRESSWKGKEAEGVSARSGWQDERWDPKASWEDGKMRQDDFQPVARAEPGQILTARNLPRAYAPDWSSRSSRTVLRDQGNLRMYEGRLTRVRQQVSVQERGLENERDLGPDRQEQFQPNEVEKMLADPLGEIRGQVKERPSVASPLAAADN